MSDFKQLAVAIADTVEKRSANMAEITPENVYKECYLLVLASSPVGVSLLDVVHIAGNCFVEWSRRHGDHDKAIISVKAVSAAQTLLTSGTLPPGAPNLDDCYPLAEWGSEVYTFVLNKISH